MALVNCPECKVEVSDKAEGCPKCAYPINSKLNIPKTNQMEKKGMSFMNWIVVAFSAIYVISPIDIIPDVIPGVGWIDDIFAGITGISTVINSQLSKTNIVLSSILKSVKYISFALFAIIGLLALLVGSTIYAMFN